MGEGNGLRPVRFRKGAPLAAGTSGPPQPVAFIVFALASYSESSCNLCVSTAVFFWSWGVTFIGISIEVGRGSNSRDSVARRTW
jgi:hypothetical protein